MVRARIVSGVEGRIGNRNPTSAEADSSRKPESAPQRVPPWTCLILQHLGRAGRAGYGRYALDTAEAGMSACGTWIESETPSLERLELVRARASFRTRSVPVPYVWRRSTPPSTPHSGPRSRRLPRRSAVQKRRFALGSIELSAMPRTERAHDRGGGASQGTGAGES